MIFMMGWFLYSVIAFGIGYSISSTLIVHLISSTLISESLYSEIIKFVMIEEKKLRVGYDFISFNYFITFNERVFLVPFSLI